MERSYIKEAFERMNLQQLTSFFLFGTDEFSIETRPYRQTLNESSAPVYRRLETMYPDGIELDKASADLSEALSAHKHVYMEIGMKAGARLIHQLLCEDEQSPLAQTEDE